MSAIDPNSRGGIILKLLTQINQLNKTVETDYKFFLNSNNLTIEKRYIGIDETIPPQQITQPIEITLPPKTNSAFLGIDFSKPQNIIAMIVLILFFTMILKRS